jgi:hypothetical protein
VRKLNFANIFYIFSSGVDKILCRRCSKIFIGLFWVCERQRSEISTYLGARKFCVHTSCIYFPSWLKLGVRDLFLMLMAFLSFAEVGARKAHLFIWSTWSESYAGTVNPCDILKVNNFLKSQRAYHCQSFLLHTCWASSRPMTGEHRDDRWSVWIICWMEYLKLRESKARA